MADLIYPNFSEPIRTPVRRNFLKNFFSYFRLPLGPWCVHEQRKIIGDVFPSKNRKKSLFSNFGTNFLLTRHGCNNFSTRELFGFFQSQNSSFEILPDFFTGTPYPHCFTSMRPQRPQEIKNLWTKSHKISSFVTVLSDSDT